MTKVALVDMALELRDAGLCPIIFKPKSKIPAVHYKNFKRRAPTPTEIEKWPWADDSNLGILSGMFDYRKGLYHFVFDFEVKDHPLIHNLHAMDVIVVETPKRGYHIHGLTTAKLGNHQHYSEKEELIWEFFSVESPKPVLIPPSIHPDVEEKKYEYSGFSEHLDSLYSLDPIKFEDFPSIVRSQLTKAKPPKQIKYNSKPIDEATLKLISKRSPCLSQLCEGQIKKGARNRTLRFIWARLRNVNTEEYAQKYLDIINTACCKPKPLTKTEIKAIVTADKWNISCHSAGRYGVGECCVNCVKGKSVQNRILKLNEIAKKNGCSPQVYKFLAHYPDLAPLRSDVSCSGLDVAKEMGINKETAYRVLRKVEAVGEFVEMAGELESRSK